MQKPIFRQRITKSLPLLFKEGFPVVDAEKIGTVEVGGTDGIEIVRPLLTVGIGGEHQFALSRERLMEMGHVEMLIGARAKLVKLAGH